MTYSYAYKSPDGSRHVETMQAKCREEVFEALRKRGIRAIKVVAADGSKANGEVRGVRKRAVALGAACLVLGAAVVSVFAFRAGENSNTQTLKHSNTSAPRHQIYGDPVIMEEIEHGKLDAYLSHPGDRYLAWFAQPGRIACPKSTPHETFVRLSHTQVTNLQAAIATPIPLAPTDPREIRELKQIVNGLHTELQAYLANGNGTIRSYSRRLLERTRQEAQIYDRTRRELSKETNAAIWEQKNEALRNLGLRTIPNPKENE